MFIGLDFFGEENNVVFDDRICHLNYDRLEMYDGTIDQIYMDENITIPYTTEKPNYWHYQTVLNAKFKNNLEGGSIEADDVQVEKIRIQKRQWNEMEWHDVAEIDYDPYDKLLFEDIDKYVANDFIYQYSLVPITATIVGNRVVSDEVTAQFEGIFISDKNANYKLLYDVELSDFESNVANALFEPRYSKYPVVVHSNLDYATFDITATFITAESMNNIENGDGSSFNVRMERLEKDKLMRFMKNGKPKVYRDHHGNIKLVSVIGNPRETPSNSKGGLSKLSFQLVEVGGMDGKSLRANNLIPGMDGAY